MLYRFQVWNETEGAWEDLDSQDLDSQDFGADDDAAAVAYARTVYPPSIHVRLWNLTARRSVDLREEAMR